jgi:hypothetical protein
MKVLVRCKCTQRTIDTDTIGPWRLRCKTCHEIIYDPTAQPAQARTETTDEERTQFNDWLKGSAELKVLMSSEGDGAQKCKLHPKYPIVAACRECEKLLCKRCLDRVGDSFTCSDCVSRRLMGSQETEGRGIGAFFKRLFSRKR